MISGNASGNINKHEGDPVISNTPNWNTIDFGNGKSASGVMIHRGRDPETGEGGRSLGCMVCNNIDYWSLKDMFDKNYNNGGVFLHMTTPNVTTVGKTVPLQPQSSLRQVRVGNNSNKRKSNVFSKFAYADKDCDWVCCFTRNSIMRICAFSSHCRSQSRCCVIRD